jgi:hypothetical protein
MQQGSLVGRFVFLSIDWARGPGSVLSPEVSIRIDEAVTSLARAVAAEGGSIAMVEQPSFSSLVAFIFGQYRAPHRVEGEEERRESPSLWIRRERERASQGRDLHSELGYLQTHSVPLEELLYRTRPLGMVCIGGGQEMVRQYATFRQVMTGGTVYVLTTTGGMAAELARRQGDNVRAIDEEILQRLERAVQESPQRVDETSEREPDLIPYPLIMQELVNELGRGETSGSPEPTPPPSSPSRGKALARGS